eukprot:355359-Chlamydomonas_euryale.AAC.4
MVHGVKKGRTMQAIVKKLLWILCNDPQAEKRRLACILEGAAESGFPQQVPQVIFSFVHHVNATLCRANAMWHQAEPPSEVRWLGGYCFRQRKRMQPCRAARRGSAAAV